jgi:hypothetical protein
VALAAHDLGVVRYPLPQFRRQTHKTWRSRYGPVRAAWLWGLDLGSGLTTLVLYAGYWLLPVAIVLRGAVGYGAAVLGLFACGRVVAIGGVSWALRPHADLARHLHALVVGRPLLRRAHAVSLACLSLTLVLLAVIQR